MGRSTHFGSIPARAGQPVVLAKGWYPSSGLSPHARGNREPRQQEALAQGSIPARAGQPPVTDGKERIAEVYPRTRGATAYPESIQRIIRGLSPHARGNLRALAWPVPAPGSIPARAGQPRPAARTRVPPTVYPRTRGATATCTANSRTAIGLSPHARGNLGLPVQRGRLAGSIPARAGQPRARNNPTALWRVYPRTRGATVLIVARPARP